MTCPSPTLHLLPAPWLFLSNPFCILSHPKGMKPLLLFAKSVPPHPRLWGYCWVEQDQSPGELPSAHPPFAARGSPSTPCSL